MEIQLNGYFDKNIGDDIMQRLVVRAFPEHTFYVNPPQREMIAHLEGEPNVICGTTGEIMINVIGTGFMFNSRMSQISALLAKCRQKYKHSAVVDCSIEHVNGRMSKIFTKKALMPYEHISCRDAYSFDFIKKLTGKGEVYYYPDIVFNQKTDKRSGNCIGIAPVRRVYGDNYAYYQKLAQAADLFVETYGEKVILFAFNNGIENDVSACGSISCLMKHREYAETVIYNSDIDAFLSKMTRCRMFISSRFHSAVLAMLEEIPLIAISDTHKLEDLADVYGFKYLKREDDISAVAEFVKNPGMPVKLSADNASEAYKHIAVLGGWLKEVSK